jgi:flagellar export protein FliJ
MKTFRFSLERLLWQRRVHEEAAERSLAGACQQERKIGADLMDVRDQLLREADAMGNRLADHMNGTEFLLHARFAGALKGREAALRRKRTDATLRTQERREELRERRRAREVVSHLREEAWVRYREAEAHETQVAMDEVAGARHNRRRTENGE